MGGWSCLFPGRLDIFTWSGIVLTDAGTGTGNTGITASESVQASNTCQRIRGGSYSAHQGCYKGGIGRPGFLVVVYAPVVITDGKNRKLAGQANC